MTAMKGFALSLCGLSPLMKIKMGVRHRLLAHKLLLYDSVQHSFTAKANAVTKAAITDWKVLSGDAAEDFEGARMYVCMYEYMQDAHVYASTMYYQNGDDMIDINHPIMTRFHSERSMVRLRSAYYTVENIWPILFGPASEYDFDLRRRRKRN